LELSGIQKRELVLIEKTSGKDAVPQKRRQSRLQGVWSLGREHAEVERRTRLIV